MIVSGAHSFNFPNRFQLQSDSTFLCISVTLCAGATLLKNFSKFAGISALELLKPCLHAPSDKPLIDGDGELPQPVARGAECVTPVETSVEALLELGA